MANPVLVLDPRITVGAKPALVLKPPITVGLLLRVACGPAPLSKVTFGFDGFLAGMKSAGWSRASGSSSGSGSSWMLPSSWSSKFSLRPGASVDANLDGIGGSSIEAMAKGTGAAAPPVDAVAAGSSSGTRGSTSVAVVMLASGPRWRMKPANACATKLLKSGG